jgi:hypothetical protein
MVPGDLVPEDPTPVVRVDIRERLRWKGTGVLLAAVADLSKRKRLAEYRSVLAPRASGALLGLLAGGKKADGVGEAERDQHDRHDAERFLGRGRQRLGRWIADPGDGGRGPSNPPPAAHEPKRVPVLSIQPAPGDEQDGAPDAGTPDAVGRVGVEPRPHRWVGL